MRKNCLFLLFAGLILAALNPSYPQNKPFGKTNNAAFDPTVFSAPNVIDSYIDITGKQVIVIKVPGVLPGKYKMPEVHPTESAVLLSNVPAYDWSFGCAPTAAAMMAGYYDNNGYPEMYTGPVNGGVAPMNNSIWGHASINGEIRALCPISATRQGLDGRTIKGHTDDYWIQAGSNSPDPYIGNWAQHDYGDCTGDFMKSNQSAWGNTDGSTIYVFYTDGSPFTGNDGSDGNYGLRLFYESRGAEVFGYYNQYIAGFNGNTIGFTFDQYKQQIDEGRPVILQLAGHSVLGLGYDNATQTAYVHNTWDYGLSALTWGGIYADMQHYGVSVMELVPLTTPILVINPPSAEAGWQAGNAVFSVVSNKTWNVTENLDWLTISPAQGTGNGTFTALYTENPSTQSRSAQITVALPQNKTGNGAGKLPQSTLPLIWENFSDNVIPAGWQVQGLGQQHWTISSYPASTGTSPPYLHLTYYPRFIGTSRMAVAPVNTTGMTKLLLVFKHAIYLFNNSYPHTFGVAVSGNGGLNWETVWSVFVTSDIYAQTINLEIENDAVGSSQFRIGFFFEGDSWGLWDWYIDNILLTEFKTSETVSIIQQGQPASLQEVSLNHGWTGISSYIIPENTDIISLLEPLDENLIIINNLEGAYWPGGNMNTLVNWNSYSGYTIKTTSAVTLTFTGLPAGNKVVSLASGWNLIPVLCSSGISVTELFSPILSQLIIVKESPGTRIFWPATNIQTLTSLQPGKSYLVKVATACEIDFEN